MTGSVLLKKKDRILKMKHESLSLLRLMPTTFCAVLSFGKSSDTRLPYLYYLLFSLDATPLFQSNSFFYFPSDYRTNCFLPYKTIDIYFVRLQFANANNNLA